MIKGCVNKDCIAFDKRTKFKKLDDQFCPKCGEKLIQVCKKCHKHIDGEKELCMRCESISKDRKSVFIKAGTSIVGGIALLLKRKGK